MLLNGKVPQLVILEICTNETWEDSERRWIDLHAMTLTNKAPGGMSPKCDPETRKANYKRMASHCDAPIAMAKRVMNLYAIQAAKRGNMDRARRFVECIVAMDCSVGSARNKLNSWAKERFGHGEEIHKEATTRQTS